MEEALTLRVRSGSCGLSSLAPAPSRLPFLAGEGWSGGGSLRGLSRAGREGWKGSEAAGFGVWNGERRRDGGGEGRSTFTQSGSEVGVKGFAGLEGLGV